MKQVHTLTWIPLSPCIQSGKPSNALTLLTVDHGTEILRGENADSAELGDDFTISGYTSNI